ncbi:MAG: hypothetical protein HS111_03155 [Kofleriaceae bacterium]|nr:hypothetical protein [Kofleriaceae bacterium]
MAAVGQVAGRLARVVGDVQAVNGPLAVVLIRQKNCVGLSVVTNCRTGRRWLVSWGFWPIETVGVVPSIENGGRRSRLWLPAASRT